jgi:hypothetical protein
MAGEATAPGPADRAHCALSFFTQSEDGSFAGYHVDFAGFVSTGKLRYVQYNHGHCTIDAATRIESCTVANDTDKAEIGKTYVDVLQDVSGSFVKTMSFDRLDVAQDYVAKRKVPEGAAMPIGFYRCPFDAAKLKAAISSDISSLAVDDRNKLVDPDKDLLADPHVAAIMAAMGLAAAAP